MAAISAATSGKRCSQTASVVSIRARGTFSPASSSFVSAISPTAVLGSCMTVTGIRFGVSDAISRSPTVHIWPFRFGLSASTYWPLSQRMFSFGAILRTSDANATSSSMWSRSAAESGATGATR